MLTKVVSVVMSVFMSLTGMFYSSFNTVLDSVSEMFFGIPCTSQAVKDDFFDEITDTDVISVDEENGYVEDLVAVFIDGNLSFSKKLAMFSSFGGTLIGWSAPIDLYVFRFLPMTYNQVRAKCNSLESKDGVVLAVPVETFRSTLNAAPNDPFDTDEVIIWDELYPRGSNWWLEAVDARQAWDYSDYFSRINIGLVDAGFDLNHPEFYGRISFPSGRLANRNSANVHGCHVAGIIGASRNNGIGISGLCDNSELICVDWYPDALQFWNTELAIFFGFAECVKAGAKVVNLSLGTSNSKKDDNGSFFDDVFSPACVSLMMSSLLSKGYDFLAVQSAGNGDYYGDPIDAKHNGHFSAVNENNIFTGLYDVSKSDILNRIIIVSSADNLGGGEYMQSLYSNTGHRVDIAAPGDDVYSCSTDGNYTYLSGTSMAAPVVTGIASLVWSVNPSFTGAQVKDIVCSSTDSIVKINDRFDYYYDNELCDYPMVNAKLSVEEALLRTNSDWGRVTGKVVCDEDVSEIVCDGVSHTVLSDGSYSFVAPEGYSSLSILDENGDEIGTVDVIIEEGATVEAPDFENTPEPPAEETTTAIDISTEVYTTEVYTTEVVL